MRRQPDPTRFRHGRAATLFLSLAMGLALAGQAVARPSFRSSPPPAPRSDVAHPASVTLTYLNAPAPNGPILRPPTLGIAVGSGEIHHAVMDTGSTGVVISASSIGNLDALPVLGEGALTYSSSGRVMQGKYVRTAVTIIGANGVTLTTRPIPVLAVERMDCLATARNCAAALHPRGIAMLGIGFARERDHQPQATPDKNPFLNLPEMGDGTRLGTLGRGYVVRRREVQVGLAPNTKLKGFDTQALSRVGNDWSAPQACISLADRMPPACGTLLVDTGVASMYLSLPVTQTDGLEFIDDHGHPSLLAGTMVRILPQAGDTAPEYQFTSGDGHTPYVPEDVVLVGGGRRPPFVNTTVRALNLFDYAYDADAGMVGFRAIPPPGPR